MHRKNFLRDTRRKKKDIKRKLDAVLDGWDDITDVNARPKGLVDRLRADQEVYEVPYQYL